MSMFWLTLFVKLCSWKQWDLVGLLEAIMIIKNVPEFCNPLDCAALHCGLGSQINGRIKKFRCLIVVTLHRILNSQFFSPPYKFQSLGPKILLAYCGKLLWSNTNNCHHVGHSFKLYPCSPPAIYWHGSNFPPAIFCKQLFLACFLFWFSIIVCSVPIFQGV